ncbi:putative fidgetin-like protein 2 isoform X2 [Cyclopterus lumpus]|uniref:putative fidgetin-like protein 2 isoform X2 n=1 Tax=Cyclopterus lumpus TaxID=8103 RepID=UPI001486F777|nr:putative fidgetin-like protein 2 isoform X2 [Cyclopterus lumpus]
MLSPIVPYSLLKMHWNPEHAQPLSQWPEQHLDVSSTTSSPAHKSELYSARGRSGYNYAWANDDISALTASNLLKRYADKYSGVLDSPYDRPSTVGTYPEPGAFGGLNPPKTELEPWPLSHGTDASYSLVPPGGHDSLSGSKAIATSAGPPGVSSVSVVNSNLSDSGYSGSSSCSGSSEYPSSYNGTYLSSGYCPQPSAALPPVPLHTLQSTPTLVPSYSPTTPVYNYPPSTYPPQTSLAPSYSHPSATYLPSGLPAPTPVPSRPTVVGGSYSYQITNLGTSESEGTLKRKAFEMSIEDDETADGSRYRKYSYEPLKAGGNSPYSVNDKTECRGNGFSNLGSTDPHTFKASKPSSQPLVSPQYGAVGEYSPPAGMTGENGVAEQGFIQQQQQHRSQAHKRSPLCAPTVETMKSPDPRLLDLVNGELLDCSPALGWGELAGLTHVKAALEEDLLWPVLRPSPVMRSPRTVLLFGPRGGGSRGTAALSSAAQPGGSHGRGGAETNTADHLGESPGGEHRSSDSCMCHRKARSAARCSSSELCQTLSRWAARCGFAQAGAAAGAAAPGLQLKREGAECCAAAHRGLLSVGAAAALPAGPLLSILPLWGHAWPPLILQAPSLHRL